MKTIYNAIMNKLTEVSKLKWIDLDRGQLEEQDRASIAFPGAIILIEIPGCKSLTDKIQDCKAVITVRLAWNITPARTSSKAPDAARNSSLEIYDTISEVYACLQGFETQNFNALSRTSQGKESRSDGLFVYKIVFECEFEDNSAE